MSILIGLIPAIVGGCIPIVVSKIGGNPRQQILGTTLGAFIVGLFLFFIIRPNIDLSIFTGGFLSGLCWSFGQYFQYKSFTKISVSVAMPISTGLQIIFTSLIGVAIFGEWQNGIMLGIFSIILVIIGVYLTTHKIKKRKSDTNENLAAGITLSLISIVGYLGYSAFPKQFNLDGWSAFFPQTAGMLVMSLLLSWKSVMPNITDKKTLYNIATGFVFSIAALSYLFSIKTNGMATGFILSQMSVVVATIGSIYILNEDKHDKEIILTMIGLALVVTGGTIISTL